MMEVNANTATQQKPKATEPLRQGQAAVFIFSLWLALCCLGYGWAKLTAYGPVVWTLNIDQGIGIHVGDIVFLACEIIVGIVATVMWVKQTKKINQLAT